MIFDYGFKRTTELHKRFIIFIREMVRAVIFTLKNKTLKHLSSNKIYGKTYPYYLSLLSGSFSFFFSLDIGIPIPKLHAIFKPFISVLLRYTFIKPCS